MFGFLYKAIVHEILEKIKILMTLGNRRRFKFLVFLTCFVKKNFENFVFIKFFLYTCYFTYVTINVKTN